MLIVDNCNDVAFGLKIGIDAIDLPDKSIISTKVTLPSSNAIVIDD